MPPTSGQKPQVIDQAQSTRALAQVIIEENKQCFTHAYISNMAKVEDVLKKKCGSDPFRIQVWLEHNPRNHAYLKIY